MKRRQRPWMYFAAAAWLALCLSACGARSALDAPFVPDDEVDAGVEAGPRSCAPDCTFGYHCCQGSCDGPAVDLPSDCCACIAGEVSSIDCPDDRCGD